MEQTNHQQIPDILPLINAESGCDYHRLILPMKYLGLDLNYFETRQIGDVIKDIKIVIFNRIPHCPVEYLVKMRDELGIKIVLDLDDYWILNPQSLYVTSWRRNHTSERIAVSMKLADAVICTTSLLADKVRPFNSNVHVIPNALPFGFEQFTEEKNKFEDGTRFIYAGGTSHYWDIKELAIPFTKVNQDKKLSKAFFNLAGYDDCTVPTKREWTKIENQFNLKGKLRNYTRYNVLSLDKYMDHYKNADVALIPLAYNNFNRFKSNLKILEAGCKRIPVICSSVEPYINEAMDAPIKFAKNAAEWYKHIKFYTENPNAAKDDGWLLGEYVRKHYDLFYANRHRQQLFDHLKS